MAGRNKNRVCLPELEVCGDTLALWWAGGEGSAEISLWGIGDTCPRQRSLSQPPDPGGADVSVVAMTSQLDVSFLEPEEAVADVVEVLFGEVWIMTDPGHGVEMPIF